MIMTDFEKYKQKVKNMQLIRSAISLWLVMMIIRNMVGRIRQPFSLLWWLEMMVMLSLPVELFLVLKILRPQRCNYCDASFTYQQLLQMDSFQCPHCGNKHFEDNTLKFGKKRE